MDSWLYRWTQSRCLPAALTIQPWRTRRPSKVPFNGSTDTTLCLQPVRNPRPAVWHFATSTGLLDEHFLDIPGLPANLPTTVEHMHQTQLKRSSCLNAAAQVQLNGLDYQTDLETNHLVQEIEPASHVQRTEQAEPMGGPVSLYKEG
ncbi:hypothetical protein CBOM_00113 [Ceraceosorus bombacis]|uniref:Uncharacterized protein n=1 Tax=Ceraceosorus bombacis TaxID=401625 RepID=A0A0N7L8W3_9BASI|nr:hypothetical protein CBOM_00113 [Ceraceosorus bombacis]